jgi:integrase/recombinase XerD
MNNTPTPELLLVRYCNDLQMNNWAGETIRCKRYYIGIFLTWSSERGIDAVSEFTPELLQAFRRHLFHRPNQRTGKPLTFKTQACYLASVRDWCAWLVEQKWIKDDPSLKLTLPKEEKQLPASFLSIDEVETLLNSVDLSTPSGLRDRAILETFYSTGIRRSELVKLDIDDLNVASRLVVIRQGKGRKDRVVPIGIRALDWINKYLIDARPEFASVGEANESLFLTTIGRRFHPNVLSQIVREYLDGIGITKKGSCHMLRHTTATLMLENGADLRSLQTLLGHDKLNTTQIYTHVTLTHLRKVHDKTHPAKPDTPPEEN